MGDTKERILLTSLQLFAQRGYAAVSVSDIAEALGIDVSQVNVKATTEEGLGFTGNKEGIAAHAVCLVYKK